MKPWAKIVTSSVASAAAVGGVTHAVSGDNVVTAITAVASAIVAIANLFVKSPTQSK